MEIKTFLFSHCPACGSSLPEAFDCSARDDKLRGETGPVFMFGAPLADSLCGACRGSLGVLDAPNPLRERRERLTKRLTVRFSESHWAELCSYAHEEGFDAAMVIRHLVARFVEDRRRVHMAEFNREVLGKP